MCVKISLQFIPEEIYAYKHKIDIHTTLTYRFHRIETIFTPLFMKFNFNSVHFVVFVELTDSQGFCFPLQVTFPFILSPAPEQVVREYRNSKKNTQNIKNRMNNNISPRKLPPLYLRLNVTQIIRALNVSMYPPSVTLHLLDSSSKY